MSTIIKRSRVRKTRVEIQTINSRVLNIFRCKILRRQQKLFIIIRGSKKKYLRVESPILMISIRESGIY